MSIWADEAPPGSGAGAWDAHPARKQADRLPEESSHGGEYNIWYHKAPSFSRGPPKLAATRCCVKADAGRTKGSSRGASQFCLHFARGCCVRGSDCTFLHRVPNARDELRLEAGHDIFGRERHSTERSDMGGVGSFSRENRTLYVGGLRWPPGRDSSAVVRSNFAEWGDLECVKLLVPKGCCFVKYRHRSCAEFAKEAMMSQACGVCAAQVNVRWAEVDPNPGTKRRERRRVDDTVVAAMHQAVAAAPGRGGGVAVAAATASWGRADPMLLQKAAGRARPVPAALPHQAFLLAGLGGGGPAAKRPRLDAAAVGEYPCTDAQYDDGAVHAAAARAAPAAALAPAPPVSALGMLADYDSDSD